MRASLIARLALAIVGAVLAALASACGTVRYSQVNGDFRVPDFSFGGSLNGVAAAAPDAAWAVGYTGQRSDYTSWRTLMMHWDGTHWTRVASPAVLNGAAGTIEGIAALSPSDVWAVGFTDPSRNTLRPLLLHWDGTRWTQVTDALPVMGTLDAIAMTAKSGGWAVGQEGTSDNIGKSLVLRWDGRSWQKIPASAALGDHLAPRSVAVTDQGTAWATALTASKPGRSEMMRLTTRSWERAAFALDRPNVQLFQVASAPDGTAWAVGQDVTGADNRGIERPPLTMHWTGTTWQAVPVPVKAAGLYGATVAADGTAWAVGGTADGLLSIRWTGSRWETVSVPIGSFPDANGTLSGVAFDSPTDGWAVGFWAPSSGDKLAKPLIVHWDGVSWN